MSWLPTLGPKPYHQPSWRNCYAPEDDPRGDHSAQEDYAAELFNDLGQSLNLSGDVLCGAACTRPCKERKGLISKGQKYRRDDGGALQSHYDGPPDLCDECAESLCDWDAEIEFQSTD